MEPNRVLRSRHVAQRGARAPAFGDVGEASVSWLSNILTSGFGAGSFLRSSLLNLYSGGMVFSSSPTSTPFSFFCFSSWEWKRELTSASCLNGSSVQRKAWNKGQGSDVARLLTETMSSGRSSGSSGFGASVGNMPPRAFRASRDMEPPWWQEAQDNQSVSL